MTTDPAVTAGVQAGWFGPCVCLEPDPDAVWRVISPDCVRCGTPEQKMTAALAAARPIIEAEVKARPDYYDAAYVEALLSRRTREVREHIADEAEAQRYSMPDTSWGEGYNAGLDEAARIARGQA